ncbi:MAG: archease [Actinomycetota bacterium]
MAAGAEAEPFEILEHTADIGLRARGRTLGELFENAAWGLAEILDVNTSSRADARPESVTLGPADIEALLVDWMNELIVRTEEATDCVAGVQVSAVGEEGLQARVDLTHCAEAPEGTELKAATYHQLAIRQTSDGFEATVYFDV